ncbi:hypothetical protein ABT084_37390 [Streptomyces sp. NPDC002138]|uniref:hypothetical protein n=1 Tax=Streptomyces sp. NPDC002138 TaxID=3154410 RepID=UPI003318C869
MDALTRTALLAYIRLHKALGAAAIDPDATHHPVEAAAREANAAMRAAGLLGATPQQMNQLLAELDQPTVASPAYVLQPHYIDVDVFGWRLDGPGLDGMHEHETFDADDNRDIEAAALWAEQIIGARQDWRHTRRDGLDRWEA